ncbi:hypothetical protein N7466_000208 [Penicillium verhagenii]|uniref:uncharacterized protein n=1 Tax=Penicillium verhagenii TaxID=1562060 RepID=UPI002544FD51|nr:uncharacterized protein N7466_000208 [Penicillium verhagenii]KAJ5947193.1 hypothetical protein N7466_000208 [Penicillium verhagenii]
MQCYFLTVYTHPQACFNCSKSKCKCVSSPGLSGCERCHRMKRQCIPGKAARSRKAENNNPIKRIAQLEDKIDSIVSHLENSRRVRHVSDSPCPPSTCNGPPIPLTSATGVQVPSVLTEPAIERSPEECLVEFRERMLKYFPFMHLPHNARWMATHRPFLLTCIMAATSQSTKVKLELGETIKQTLIQRVYFDNNADAVNLDLLLGLLTFIAWGHDSLLHGTAARVSRFAHLAMTLTFSLRLNKPPPADSNMLPMDKPRSIAENPQRTPEERRAVLGCFYMSSIVSSYFGQIDTMQWTPYMDECMDVLSEKNESVYDHMFIQQIKLQRVAVDIEEVKGTEKVPPAFYLAGLRHRMNNIKMQIPPQLLQDGIMLSSVYYTELSISGLMLCTKGFPDSQGLENLYDCLNTIKSALSNFFRVPVSDYHGIPFPFFIQFTRTIVVLIKLSTTKDAFWDSALVSGTVDVLQVMDRLLSNIDAARTAIGDQGKDGFLDKAFKVFTSVKAWCSAKLQGMDGSENVAEIACDLQFEDLFLDDDWLKDYLVL